MSNELSFEEQYDNFFQFFNQVHSKNEIREYIEKNKIPSFSPYNQINLNMIDPQNLNILFYIVKTSSSDEDCLEKLILLIEEYNVNYNVFDFNYQRRIPFYTCIKGYLKSTKYIIDKMEYDIQLMDKREQTLFFNAFKSYNLDLVNYLDQKFPRWIFYPDNNYNSCIYSIFKKDMNKQEEIKKFEKVLKFIIKRGFDIYEVNNDNISFIKKCEYFQKMDILENVIREVGGETAKKYFMKKNGNNIINDLKIDDNDKKNKDIINDKISNISIINNNINLKKNNNNNNNNNIENKNIINKDNINNIIKNMSNYLESHNNYLEKIENEKKEKSKIKDKEFNNFKNSNTNILKEPYFKNESKNIKILKTKNNNININEQKNIFEGINNNWSIKLSSIQNNELNPNQNISKQNNINIANENTFPNLNVYDNNISTEKKMEKFYEKMDIETNCINNKDNNNFSNNSDMNDFIIKNFNEAIDNDKNKSNKKFSRACIFFGKKSNMHQNIEKIKKLIKNNKILKKFSEKIKQKY